MKLTSFQLEQHLAKTLAAIYIISGDELLLKQDAIRLIRAAAKQAGYSERIRIAPEAGFDWEQLYLILNSTSLLADKRLIELDFRDTTPNKAASTILQEYGNNPSKDNVLLIDIGKIDDKISRSAWYKALEKPGMVINIWPIPREQLPQWIMQRAKKYKIQMQQDAAVLLADYVEGNLIAAAQTLEKIYLLQPQTPVNADMIQSILTDESHYTIFDFVECVITRDKSRALHILDSLKNEGIEAVLILWGITRELRILADMARQIKQGSTCDTLFQSQRIFARRQPAIRQFLMRSTAENCWNYLMHAAEIDRIIKGAAPGDSWNALQLFCLRLV